MNTVRQVGSVIGSSAVGALLENRLAATLAAQATSRGSALPPQYRATFVHGFVAAAKNGSLEAGGSGSPTASGLPANLPKQVVDEINRIATAVFQHGFVQAVHSTLVLPIVVVILGAVGCVFVKRQVRTSPQDTAEPVSADLG